MSSNSSNFVNPLPHAMRWGFVLGIVFSLNFLCGSSSSVALQMLTYFITAFSIVLTWRFATNFRDKEANYTISFYQAFSYILILYFFAALVSAVVKLIYIQIINPNYLAHLIETTKTVLDGLEINLPDDYEQGFSSMLNPANFVMQVTMFNTLLGALVGLFLAPFIKKNNNQAD